jgi:general secretion pathway protein I
MSGDEYTNGSAESAGTGPRPDGFTLLEVMVAVAIMAMVLVTLIGLKNRTMQDVTLMEHMTQATLLSKRLMTGLIMVKPRLPMEEEGEFSEEEFKGYTWKKTIAPTPLIDIMEVRVAVFWKEGTRQEQVELVGYE